MPRKGTGSIYNFFNNINLLRVYGGDALVNIC
jgi:hypothetical protein